jgi:uncharacterized protein YndB with AHSA1/START domain
MLNKDLVVNRSTKINADKSQVWEALVNPEKIKQYLFGTDTVSDWKVGSPIIFQGEWQGQAYIDKGTILQFEENEIFQYDYWSAFSGTEDLPENYSVITLQLKEEGTVTILSLTHQNYATEENRDHSDKSWEMVLNSIKELVEKK